MSRSSEPLNPPHLPLDHFTGYPSLFACARCCPDDSERITGYRARDVTDWVMYRKALALAAETRGWRVDWYGAKTVLDSATRALGVDDFDACFHRMRKAVGAPWNNDHKLALASAISAADRLALRS